MPAAGNDRQLPHPSAGAVPQGAPAGRSRAPPLRGEHTGAVLSERPGLSAAQRRELRASGALGKVPL